MRKRLALAVALCLMTLALAACFPLVSPQTGTATRGTVCMWGDSVFWDAETAFKQLLPADGIAFVNKAVPGDGLSELDTIYLPTIADVNASLHCDVNIAELGNNDLLATDPVQVAGVTPYVQRFLAAFDPNVPFVWVLPTLHGPAGWDETIVQNYDDVVAALVSQWSPIASTVNADHIGYETSTDHLHPDDVGDEQIAQYVDQFVDTALSATTTTTTEPDSTTTTVPDTTTTVPDTTTTVPDTTSTEPDTTTTAAG